MLRSVVGGVGGFLHGFFSVVQPVLGSDVDRPVLGRLSVFLM